jgi:cell pole-organizing protein PopZ
MSDAKSPHDLSMDEILATIRRIIAEDEKSSTSPPSAAAAKPGGSRAAETMAETATATLEADGVLELTDAIEDDGTVRRLALLGERGAEPPAPPPPLPPLEAATAEPKPEPEPAADAAPLQAVAEQGGSGDERLVSDITSLAAAAAFARLASTPRGRREPPPMLGDQPLDEVVRDLLRPLLRTWLDENLPGIVERLVEAEIAKIGARSAPG